MINNVMLLGRVNNINEDGTKVDILIRRLLKNTNGEYDVDNIPCKISNDISDNILNYCCKGDLIGIKGRISVDENKNLFVISEKVTFITPKNNEKIN